MEHFFVFILLAVKTAVGDSSVELVASKPTVTVNDSLELTCYYKGVETIHAFEWVFQEHTFDSVNIYNCQTVNWSLNHEYGFLYSYACPDINTNIMIIDKVTSLILGKVVSCSVYIGNMSVVSNTVLLDIQVPITFVNMSSPTEPILSVEENKEIDFVCETSFGNPTANVTWYIHTATPKNETDDNEIKVNISSSEKNGIAKSVLKYYPTRPGTWLGLYCKANNIQGQKPLISTRKTLIIGASQLPAITKILTIESTTTANEDKLLTREFTTTVQFLETTTAMEERTGSVDVTTTTDTKNVSNKNSSISEPSTSFTIDTESTTEETTAAEVPTTMSKELIVSEFTRSDLSKLTTVLTTYNNNTSKNGITENISMPENTIVHSVSSTIATNFPDLLKHTTESTEYTMSSTYQNTSYDTGAYTSQHKTVTENTNGEGNTISKYSAALTDETGISLYFPGTSVSVNESQVSQNTLDIMKTTEASSPAKATEISPDNLNSAVTYSEYTISTTVDSIISDKHFTKVNDLTTITTNSIENTAGNATRKSLDNKEFTTSTDDKRNVYTESTKSTERVVLSSTNSPAISSIATAVATTTAVVKPSTTTAITSDLLTLSKGYTADNATTMSTFKSATTHPVDSLAEAEAHTATERITTYGNNSSSKTTTRYSENTIDVKEPSELTTSSSPDTNKDNVSTDEFTTSSSPDTNKDNVSTDEFTRRSASTSAPTASNRRLISFIPSAKSTSVTTPYPTELFNSTREKSIVNETEQISSQASVVSVPTNSTTTATATEISHTVNTYTIVPKTKHFTENTNIALNATTITIETTNTVSRHYTDGELKQTASPSLNFSTTTDATTITTENANTVTGQSTVAESKELSTQVKVSTPFDPTTIINSVNRTSGQTTFTQSKEINTKESNAGTPFDPTTITIKATNQVSTSIPKLEELSSQASNVSTPLHATTITTDASNTTRTQTTLTEPTQVYAPSSNVNTPFDATETNIAESKQSSTQDSNYRTPFDASVKTTKTTYMISGQTTEIGSEQLSTHVSNVSTAFDASAITTETTDTINKQTTVTKPNYISTQSPNIIHPFNDTTISTEVSNTVGKHSSVTETQNLSSQTTNANTISDATTIMIEATDTFITNSETMKLSSQPPNDTTESDATTVSFKTSHTVRSQITTTEPHEFSSQASNVSNPFDAITITIENSSPNIGHTATQTKSKSSEASTVFKPKTTSVRATLYTRTTQPLTLSTLLSENVSHSCPEMFDERKTQWNVTQPGDLVMISCSSISKELSGNVYRQCTDTGIWLPPRYDCVSKDIEEIQNMTSAWQSSPSSEIVETVLGKLSELTKTKQENGSVFSGEIEVITSILDDIASLKNSSVSQNQSKAFLETASNLLDVRNKESWQAINQYSPHDEVVSGAEKLLGIVDTYTEAIAKSLDESEVERTIVASNLLLQVRKIKDPTGVVFPDVGKHQTFANRSTLHISSESLKGSTVFSAVLYRNLSGILSTRARFSSHANSLDSAVVAAKLNNWKRNSNFKITIEFEHSKVNNMTATCSFLNENSTLWEKEGCILKSSNSSTTVCECNHLTNFAILLSPWTADNIETKAIRVISIVGCSLSIIGLLVTVLIHFIYWRYLKSDRVKILMNICIALVISYVLFLGGVDRTENKDMCMTVAVLLQYIYLVVFFLMLAEGIEMYFAVRSVFNKNSRLKWSLPSAWLIPGIIVGASVGITRTKGYGNDHFCWLSVDNGLIWAFAGPALVILLFNSIILGFVIRALFIVKARRLHDDKDKIITGVRCLCVLLPLIGCTWIIGIFYVNRSFAWIQYVFAVCNTSQGFVIFIFHCVLNKQVKKAYTLRQLRRESVSLSTSKTASKLLFIPRVTTHTSSSALYSVTNESGKEIIRHGELEMQENGTDSHHHIEMKRFRYISDYNEDGYTEL